MLRCKALRAEGSKTVAVTHKHKEREKIVQKASEKVQKAAQLWYPSCPKVTEQLNAFSVCMVYVFTKREISCFRYLEAKKPGWTIPHAA